METTLVLPKSWPRTEVAVSKIKQHYNAWLGLFVILVLFKIPPTVFFFMAASVPESARPGVQAIARQFLPAFALLMFLYAALMQKFDSREELGLQKCTMEQVRVMFALTFICVAAIMIFRPILEAHTTPDLEEKSIAYYQNYLGLSCPAQEFLYRGLIFAELLRRGVGKYPFIVISSLNFMYLHIFYMEPMILLLTFLVGILWGWFFWKYRNLWLCMVSHMIIGVPTIVLGFV